MNGYTPVPLNLSAKKPVLSYIYVRKHAAKDDGTSAVFVANLPYDTTQDNIKDLCSALGSVILERFEYQGRNRGLLHLVDDSAVSRFLAKAAKASTSKKYAEWARYGPRGAEGYTLRQQLRFPSEESLQKQVDEYMEEYAELEASRKQEVEEAAGAVDADGFQTVVNTKRKQLPAESSGAPTTNSRKKKRTHEKEDFYRFQLRENRKQEMNDLLKRYQQDKDKVAELQKKRMLNPWRDA